MKRSEEIAEKRRRLKEWLDNTGYEVVILSGQAYWAWYTAGGTNRVVMCADTGPSFLVLDGEHDCVLTNAVEAPRIEQEEIAGLDRFQLVEAPWWDREFLEKKARALINGRKSCSDTGAFGTDPLPADFQRLTWQLTPPEIERYRVLGRECSEVMEEELAEVSRGDRETDVAARLGRALLERNIIPNLLLVAADERVMSFRHPVPTSRKIDRYFMAVICGKRDGLIMNVTRFAAFADVGGELEKKFDSVCRIDAFMNARTVPGAKIADMFAALRKDYVAEGYDEEWHLHHQGGPTGYQGRSYLAVPDSREVVMENQAFAWNPSITGAKCEDTVLATSSGVEFFSAPVKWPVIEVGTDAGVFKRPTLWRK